MADQSQIDRVISNLITNAVSATPAGGADYDQRPPPRQSGGDFGDRHRARDSARVSAAHLQPFRAGARRRHREAQVSGSPFRSASSRPMEARSPYTPSSVAAPRSRLHCRLPVRRPNPHGRQHAHEQASADRRRRDEHPAHDASHAGIGGIRDRGCRGRSQGRSHCSATATRFDAVLLDQKMPGMDGIATLQQIRERAPTARVIMITAFGSIELAVDAMKLGATDFLRKPITPEALRSALAAALSKTPQLAQAGPRSPSAGAARPSTGRSLDRQWVLHSRAYRGERGRLANEHLFEIRHAARGPQGEVVVDRQSERSGRVAKRDGRET